MKTEPKSFASRARFRAWLQRNHAKVTELNMRVSKVHAGARGVVNRRRMKELQAAGLVAPPALAALQAGSKKPAGFCVMSAKQEDARQRRIGILDKKKSR